jgi:hypothetical protein
MEVSIRHMKNAKTRPKQSTVLLFQMLLNCIPKNSPFETLLSVELECSLVFFLPIHKEFEKIRKFFAPDTIRTNHAVNFHENKLEMLSVADGITARNNYCHFFFFFSQHR